jgi:nucleoside recognition membrane protein YjiH
MKTQCIVILALLFSISAIAQQTRFYSDTEEKFKEAKEYFQKEEYSLAFLY